MASLCTHGAALRDSDRPVEALFDRLGSFLSHVATKRDLATAVTDDVAGERPALFDDRHPTMRAVASDLLERAVRAGGSGRTSTICSPPRPASR